MSAFGKRPESCLYLTATQQLRMKKMIPKTAISLTSAFLCSYVTGAPIHIWSFDEGSGTVAVDSVGGADAELVDATWTEDRFGNAGGAVQTGYNQWVNPPNTVKMETGTFAAWIYLDEYGGPNQTEGPIFSGENGSGASYFSYRLQVDPAGKLIFEATAPKGTGSARYAESALTLDLNKWTHVAGTYDGYTTRVYINGSLEGSTTYETFAAMGTDSYVRVGIGHLEGWKVQWFQGRIDDARVYDTALGEAELADLIRPTHLLGYPINSDYWADTGAWLGWINARYAPWIWVHSMNKYLYFDEASGWSYILK
jgi:hypothetical protein